MSEEPLHKTEPRAELEARCEALSDIIAGLLVLADDIGCECRVCDRLRRLATKSGL